MKNNFFKMLNMINISINQNKCVCVLPLSKTSKQLCFFLYKNNLINSFLSSRKELVINFKYYRNKNVIIYLK